MYIVLNGEEIETGEGLSIAELLQQLGHDHQALAVAVNGEFLPKQRWEEHLLQAGESVELIAPMQGG